MSAQLLASLLTQNAITWARASTNADGQPTWSTPAAATCSPWRRINELVLGPLGERRQATVGALVSATVVQGAKLALGTFSGGTPATPTADALEVLEVASNTTPLDGETVYRAKLGG